MEHRIRRRFQIVEKEESMDNTFTRHILGPLKVIAILPETEDTIGRIFATQPNGYAIYLVDQSGVRMFDQVCLGDTLLCANAIHDLENGEPEGVYAVFTEVIVLRGDKTIELEGWEPDE